ncbi:non-ribosomal peptide synthase/polyketide synthase [Pseudomonas kermanshahensis]|uniref:non-ribosomal peptide synthase/polyketide synthase n=1 Tax=Pseudomonas kermanshahensis TaxID=2745482 RepID=UPI002093D693|nr:non-ribosomal peptide synthase/polyketide synthase [Pseudomonas kermanshahensis]USS54776.1 non-ribosomal peptide synthase/polyketide synthase [Pseudomonas kermanshahensis]
MELTAAQRIAQRFVGLPVEQRQQILEKMQATGQSFRLLPIVPARQGLARIPLSFAQQRLLFLWQLEPDSPAYNVPMAVRLKGALDLAVLQQALDALVSRHESLRTRFVSDEGEFHQDILDTCPLVLDVVECQDDEGALSVAVDAALKQPFDLLAGPLMRVTLLRVDAEHHVLALSMHHIISDGWSSDLLVQEFIQLYTALAEGRQAVLPALPIQYADYAIWQRAWLEAGEAQRQLAYWQAQLGDEQPLLSLPLDFERPATPSYRGAVLKLNIGTEQAEALRAQARKGGHTVFVLMLAAMAVVLSRYSGQSDIRIGAPNAGRNRTELEGLIGFFINTQVLRVQVDERATFAALLEQVKDVIGGAQSHQELPFEHLVDALLPERNLAHNPLFQFKINQHVAAGDPSRKRLGELEVEGFAREGGDARFDLAFDFSDKADGIEGYFTYATDLFEQATIERLADSLRRVLDVLSHAQHTPIVEHLEVAAQQQAAPAAYPHRDFLALWHQAMAQGQAQGGVRAGDRFMTQAGLDAASNRVADYLRQRGVGAGSIVALCLPRSIEWVTALLAVLKAGAAYLPLDTQQPQERLQQLIVDSGAAVLLHEPGDTRFAGLDGVQAVACEAATWAGCSDSRVEVAVSPEQPAYLIYTSGSTGQPKGVVVSHGALASYLQAMLERLQLPAGASMAMVSTTAADLGHTVLFGALASGRLLHLLPQELAFDPDGFAGYMAQHQVGVVKLVPSHLQGLLQASRTAEVLPAEALILGGEACPWSLLEKVRELRPGCRVINHYGPTETTVGVLTFEPGQRLQGCRTVPVGRPLGNACAQVLDGYLNPLAPHVVGELYLGGQGVAQGYLGQPGLTAERFVPAAGGARLYRTGDRARMSAEGLIEFIGRADDQVKIRGYRVEPGEIGRVIAGLPGVSDAVVLAVPLEGDAVRLQLVAYVVAEGGMSTQQLQAHLQARLPDYMVPAHILLLERLPLTANGKLDKRALPTPGAVSRGYVAPEGEIEEKLATVWADVLKLERVGSSDNFFELGGDSILSLQIIARAKRQGIKITPKQLFEQQTVGQLAQVAKRIEAKQPLAAPVDTATRGEVALLPAQVRFFEMDIAQPAHWNQSVLLKPAQRVQVEHLEAALRAVLEQHDALRLRFSRQNGQWQARFQALDASPVVRQRSLAALSELDAAGTEVQASLDLEHGPLLRAELFDVADGQQRLLLVIHHLVVDGVSWRVLLEDLQEAYQQRLNGQVVSLPAKTCAVKTWAERLVTHASSPALHAQADYWQHVLQGSLAELPRDNPQGSLGNQHARTAASRLDAARTAQLLKQAPAAYRTQVNDLLLTALARTLCQWSAQDEVLVQLEGHGREDLFDDLDLSRTVGWFTSVFPVRLAPGQALGPSIKAIKEQLRAVPDKGIGYGLLRYLGDTPVRERLSGTAQPRVTFNYLGQFDSSFTTDDTALFSPSGESAGRTQCAGAQLGNWLSITGQVYGGELFLEWTYSDDVYRAETIQQLAQAYEQALAELVEHCCQAQQHGVTPSDFPLAALTQGQLDSLPVPAAQIADVYPLSPMQQGMLFHTLYDQQAGNYINQLRVDVEGLDVQRFKQAWQAALDAHDILRSSFVLQGELEQAVQVVRKSVALPCSEHDWRGQPALEQALQALAEGERQQGFELTEAPLLRLVLVQTGEARHHLIYTNHHILMDGWSTSRLLGEVLQRYAGMAPKAQATHYRDYIAWLQGQDAAVAEAFWQAQLAALDAPTRLAQAIAGSAGDAGSGYGDHRLALDAEQTARIEAFARANRVTVNTLVQSAWLLLLQRYTGQASVCFGATVAGRPADLAGVEEQIGLFINTLPVIGAPRAEQTVAEWISQVQACNLAVREFEHTPLYDVQRWAGQGGDALFDSILVFENYPVSEALQQGAPGGLRFGDVAVQEQTNYPLTLVVELGATLSMQYSHDRALWSDESIGRLAGYFTHLLQALVADAGAVVGELPMLGLQEQQLMVEGWNDTVAAYPNERSIHSLIEAQVFATPDAPALVFGEQTLSYAELNGKANQLAHKLRELGVGPDVLVGIAMERSLEMVIGLLGIVKAGGAYVPLDPEYPQDRLSYMFEDSGIALLLTQSHLRAALPIPAGLRSLDLDSENLDGYSDANPGIDVAPLNLAYVIYTSGSTGRPKGAGNSHQALVNRLWWMQKAYGLDASDSVLQKTPFSFDVSVWEFFWPLMTGARLVIAQPGAHRDPQLLVDSINQNAISTLHFVPSMLQAFMTHEAVESCRSLKRVVCSGEALPAELARQTLQRLPAAGLYNLYGPTEAAIDVTHWTCRPDESISVPIGQPIDNLKTHILEGSLQPAVRGSAGELYLGGVGLARGYHQRPALTAERFVPDPFSDNGGRLYRTGDLARYNADGVIDYAGRLDHQVKIRGLRIELGEIEARLLELPAVQEAVVLAQDGPSGKQLVGYVVPADSTQDEAVLRDSLREALKAGLPDYMVPAHLLLLGKLPVTPNGKLDRKALPQPDASLLQGEYVAPQSELEQQIAAIWADVLKLEKVGLTDNFFELGGDSIISLQVVSRARLMDIQFTPKELFEAQTVQALATVARREDSTFIDQGAVTGTLPLTPIQHWFFEREVPERHHWNQSVLLKPNTSLQATQLDAALRALVEHHDALRLRFVQSEATGQAEFAQAQAAQLLWVLDLPDAAALEHVANDAQRSLVLEQGPLLRAVLASLPDGSQRLLLVIHHLVVDGVSWRVLLEDLQQAYRALAAFEPVSLPAKTSSFKAWAEHLQAYAHGAELQAELGYWQGQLQDASDALPCDHLQGSNQQRHAASFTTRLDRETTRQLLQDAPAAYRTQINDLLLTALAQVVGGWTQREEVLVRLEGHGREDLFDDIDLSRTVGWFTSMYPVKLSPKADVASSIKTIKEQLRAVPNKGLGYGLLRYLGGAEASATLAALPQGEIVFNYLGQFDGSFDESGLFVPAQENDGIKQNEASALSSLLSLSGQVYGGELRLEWGYSQAIHEAETIERLATAYQLALTEIVAHCCLEHSRGVTPSDFPLAGLNQAQLDSLPVPASQIADVYPLSPMQQGMLFHTLYEEQAGNYINQLRVDVDGLDVERFRQAWQAALDAHPVLRSGFVWQGTLDQAVQVVHKRVALPFTEHDWRGLPELEHALQTLAAGEREQGFTLDQAPLLRLVLVRTGAGRHQLIYTSHHILMDGWSSSRLLGEVLQHYAGYPLPTQAGNYRDYIAWLQRQDGAAAEAFWMVQLNELQAPTHLVQAICEPQASTGTGQHDLEQHFDAQQTARIETFARANRVTVNTLVQAAWLLVLQRYTGQASVCFGATVAGRPAELAGVETQIGLFINTLPVVGAPRAEQTVGDWIAQVQTSNLALREFEHTPLYDVQRWAGLGGEALFDTLVVFESYPVSEALKQGAPGGLQFGDVGIQEQTNYPLTLLVSLGETLSIQYRHDLARWNPATLQQVARHLSHLLQAMTQDAGRVLGELSLFAADEQQQILQGWNPSHGQYPDHRAIHHLIEAQVQRAPNAPALAFGEQTMSYGELNRRANRLAHKLRELGVGPDVRVGIAMERGLEMVIGLLGILKAGGAYVPLDPGYPSERLAYLFEDSGIELLLTQQHLADALPVPAEVQCLDIVADAFAGYSDANPAIALTPDNLAYVIYTSGSTGKPKGTLLPHGNVVRLFAATHDWFAFDASDVWTVFHSYAFDFSVWELFGALVYGGKAVIVAKDVARDFDAFHALLVREHVTVLNQTPSAFKQLMPVACERATAGQKLALRHVVFGGEALEVASLKPWFEVFGDSQPRLINMYGITETTVHVTYRPITLEDLHKGATSPIGEVIPDLSWYLLDAALHPAVPGGHGELVIGEAGLARGYHGRAGLTAERFVPNPFGAHGGRLYRSGDLARYRTDGVIEYMGRIDHQVKIRGFRIELGEIEACLLNQQAVRQVAVLAQEGPSGPQLVGYVVPADVAALASVEAQAALRDTLRASLKADLPDYMVPTHLLLLDTLPLTVNGKLDRKALPQPDARLLQSEYLAPRSELEQQVAAVWAEVLKLEKVGLTDNFFELGGHSLLATQVLARLQIELGVNLPLALMFQAENLQAYAAMISELNTNSDEDLDELQDFMNELEAI